MNPTSTTRLSRRRHTLLLVLSLGLVIGACAVPVNGEPQTIAADGVPFRLLQTTTTSTSTTVPPPIEVRKAVYLLEQNAGISRLRRVERSFAAGVSDVRDVLRALINNPVTQEEIEAGLSSSIPEGGDFLGADLDDSVGILTVQVDGIFGALESDGLRRALAQIVYTATADEQVRRVRFRTASGDDVEALIDNNRSAPVVDRSDFRNLQPTN